MTPLFKKLNFKDEERICILNAPESFASEMESMSEVTEVLSDIPNQSGVPFVLAFAITQQELDHYSRVVTKCAGSDAKIWIAYPKKSSKKYKCEFDRDSGWNVLGDMGYEPVRMVAIDADWSALRFRRTEYIKTLTRGFAISEEGKKRTSG
ncbi:MAG: hypothetical protein KDC26_08315 [Armatimonadetes bacterium]|nr:hypothetical protein [Armatimonadota bacterium]